MAKPSDHPGFQALLAEWNQRLLESGFFDIEQPAREKDQYAVGSGLLLIRDGNRHHYETLDSAVREAKADFYRCIAQKVHETDFQKEREKQILTLFSQGHSKASIQRMLEIPGHRCQIYYPINRWLRAWGLKK